jgi:hypothetical protein
VGARSGPATGPGISRRRLLAGMLLVPPALAGCTAGPSGPTVPDPLIALAAAARSDAALAAAAIAADPDLTDRVQPLVDARTQHAAALDAEVARLDPERTPAVSATRSPAPAAGRPGLAEVREAVLASGSTAADAALTLPAERVGLVASVAACCNTYGAVLA